MNVEIEGDSDAAVALALLQMIAKGEDKEDGADRAWVLSTFRLCLAAVREDVLDMELEEEELLDEEDEEDEEEVSKPD